MVNNLICGELLPVYGGVQIPMFLLEAFLGMNEVSMFLLEESFPGINGISMFLLVEAFSDINGVSMFPLVEEFSGINGVSMFLLVEAFPYNNEISMEKPLQYVMTLYIFWKLHAFFKRFWYKTFLNLVKT